MSKRQELREKKAAQERNQKIFMIVGVVLVAAAIAAFMILPTLTPAGKITSADPIVRTKVSFNTAGDPNAPVKIVEYSDFQCPYCGNFVHQTEKLLVDAYVETGKVYFEYRSFGEFIGPESKRSAEAAYCAGDQEKFWDMHDLLFANQNGENKGGFSDKRLVAFAESLKLDMTAFNDCFNSNKYEAKVLQDGVDGNAAGVQATPSFLVNGKLVEGAQPFTAFQTEIDALIK